MRNQGLSIRRTHVGQNAKAVLREFAAQLPEVVERAAATSKRTELEIATEILDRIASIISQ